MRFASCYTPIKSVRQDGKQRKKELSGEEETRLFRRTLFLPALDAQIFMAREFFLRCFASILVAIISTYLHCPHARLLMFVSEKKNTFFLFQKIRSLL